MEIAAETKVQFEEFMEAEGFDEKLSAIYEQGELAMNSAETIDQLKTAERRHVKSIIEYIARMQARFAAQLAAQRVVQDLIQRASDSCDLIKAHQGGLIQWKR